MMPPELLDAAEHTTGFMPTAEGIALHEAALDALPRGPVLEVGTYCGRSTIFLAAAAREVGGRVVTVDHHRGSEEHQVGWEYHDPALTDEHGRVDTLARFRRTLAECGLEPYVIAVVGRSADVAEVWHSPLGMVFVDGGHTDEAAKADFEGWAHRIVRHGLLVIHDVFPDPADGGQAPYGIYRRALDGGSFVERRAEGSLRVLQRVHGDAGDALP
ncbi:MAG TPA: class I SAM-dependent methyltransferase [Nocardioidaceae bacterium]|nr:class I SAM-dependent methyltransferase [Nocardioidaceae bacterium]